MNVSPAAQSVPPLVVVQTLLALLLELNTSVCEKTCEMEERVKFKMIADEQLIAREESLNLTEYFKTRIADSSVTISPQSKESTDLITLSCLSNVQILC